MCRKARKYSPQTGAGYRRSLVNYAPLLCQRGFSMKGGGMNTHDIKPGYVYHIKVMLDELNM
jgi:hypothetical protein